MSRGYEEVREFRKTTNKFRSLCGVKKLGLIAFRKASWSAYTGDGDKAGMKMPWNSVLTMACDLISLDMCSSECEVTPKKHIEWWCDRREDLNLNEDTLWVLDVIFQRMIRGKFEGVLADTEKLEKLRSTYEA